MKKLFFGKYKGFVRDNADPENRGRIRCFCPQVMGGGDVPDTWLGWAEACLPWFGGINTGDFGPPYTRAEQVEAEGEEYFGVWLEFEAGDPDFPIWVGTFSIAPTATSEGSHAKDVSFIPGGGVIGRPNLPEGSDDTALNPPKPVIQRETRIIGKRGRDIVIGVDGGGSLILGPSGVSVQGIQVLLNGLPVFTSGTDLG